MIARRGACNTPAALHQPPKPPRGSTCIQLDAESRLSVNAVAKGHVMTKTRDIPSKGSQAEREAYLFELLEKIEEHLGVIAASVGDDTQQARELGRMIRSKLVL